MLTKNDIAAVREAFNAWLDEMETEPVKVTHGPMDVRITLVPPEETAADIGARIADTKANFRQMMADKPAEDPPWKAPYEEFKRLLADDELPVEEARRLAAQMALAGMDEFCGQEWERMLTALRILDPTFNREWV